MQLVISPDDSEGYLNTFIPLDLSLTEGAFKNELYMSFDDKDKCNFFARLQELGLWADETGYKGIKGFDYKPFAWTQTAYDNLIKELKHLKDLEEERSKFPFLTEKSDEENLITMFKFAAYIYTS